jgi:hypothetical protein
MKCIAGAEKYPGIQLLEGNTPFLNNIFRHCEPMPKA